MTRLGRMCTAKHGRPAAGFSMIALIVLALIGSGGELGVSLPNETSVAAATSRPASERSVERAYGAPLRREGVRRTAYRRSTAPVISRVQVPGGAGTDGPRAAALGATLAGLELGTHQGSVQLADGVARGATSPGQPAPSSRAPPLG